MFKKIISLLLSATIVMTACMSMMNVFAEERDNDLLFVDELDDLSKTYKNENIKIGTYKTNASIPGGETRAMKNTADDSLEGSLTYKISGVRKLVLDMYKNYHTADLEVWSSTDDNNYKKLTVETTPTNTQGWVQYTATVANIPADTNYIKIVIPVLSSTYTDMHICTVKFYESAVGELLWDLEGHWSRDAVASLALRGAVNGDENGTFYPERGVTTVEFLKMLIISLEDKGKGYDASDWETHFIRRAEELNILKNGELDYNAGLNRESAAMLISRAINETSQLDSELFKSKIKDFAKISPERVDDVLKMFTLGIMEGNDDCEVNPKSVISRAEAATLIFKAYEPSFRKTLLYSVKIYADASETANAEKMNKLLLDNGFNSEIVTKENLADITTTSSDCVFLFNGYNADAKGKTALLDYLYKGGDLVVCGSNMFSELNKPDMKIPIYEGYDYFPYKLDSTEKIASVEGQDILKTEFSIEGEFDGTSAISYAYDMNSVYIPILEAQTKGGTHRGYAAGVTTNVGGSFIGSNWLEYGIETPEFYSTDVFMQSVLETLQVFDSSYLEDTYNREKLIEKNRKELEEFELTEEPLPKLTISEDGQYFVDENGKPVYMVGTNTFAGIQFFQYYGNKSQGTFSVSLVENYFKQMSDMGINYVRFWYPPTDPEVVDVFKQFARKYGIYFLINPQANYPTKEALYKSLKQYAEVYGNDTMILGYDLLNEPLHYICCDYAMDENGSIEGFNAWDYYQYLMRDDASFEEAVTYHLDSTFSASKRPALNEKQRQSMAVWHVLIQRQFVPGGTMWGYTTEPLNLNPDPKIQEGIKYYNEAIRIWLREAREYLHQWDEDAMVTIGWSNLSMMMQGNDEQDFMNNHEYHEPIGRAELERKLKIYDGMHEAFPNKPTIIGEFSLTAGQKLANGAVLEATEVDMLDVMEWLYGWANGYAGAARWMLYERPPVYTRYDNSYFGFTGLDTSDPTSMFKLEHFGAYYYSGNPDIRYSPKGNAIAMSFFNDYMDTHTLGDGDFKLIPSIGIAESGFEFTDEGTLYVATNSYNTDKLKFESDLIPMVMLDYTDGKSLNMVTTYDVTAEIKLSEFINADINNLQIDGDHEILSTENGYLKIKLYKGVKINIKGGKN